MDVDASVDMAKYRTPQIAAIRASLGDKPVINVAVAGTDLVFRCRPHTSDLEVVFDTFHVPYHLPSEPLPEAPVILDLGSNIGCTLAHFDRLYSPSRMIGVELDKANWSLAVANVELNKVACDVLNAAVWPEDGEVAYGGGQAFGLRVMAEGKDRVQAVSLGAIIAEHGLERIDFVKMDIEGGEHAIFDSDLAWLGPVQQLNIEVHDPKPAETLVRIAGLLVREGFSVRKSAQHWSALHAVRT